MTTPAHTPVRRALLSVSDKSGLADFAGALAEFQVELVSTGGTARALRRAGLDVRDVSDLTQFPELLDGRVKTLHPNVHAGILARRDDPHHAGAMAEHAIAPIDLVCVNLYPFEQTVAKPGVDDDDAIEQIDIGGPSMVRSAAKNHASVTVVTDPAQYARVLDDMRAHDGATGPDLRRALAVAAFWRTAAYDAAIARHFDPAFAPARLTVPLERAGELRYGENPHQPAAVYRDPAYAGPSVVTARQRAGKQLSYNNLNDAAAALALALALGDRGSAGAAIVKHTNPCGAATAPTPDRAIELAIAGDPLAAYGGILATSRAIDARAAGRIAADASFFEVVIAPDFEDGAVEALSARWKNCRLLAVGSGARPDTPELRWLPGGALLQAPDTTAPAPDTWTHAAGPAPDEAVRASGAALECIVRALSSNAVCLGGPDGDGVRLFGAGAGQMDRVAACRLAVEKAGDRARGSIAFSDAFFPFPDGPRILVDAGVRAIIHPGGSKRDQETFDLCDASGVTCLTTGIRHFRH